MNRSALIRALCLVAFLVAAGVVVWQVSSSGSRGRPASAVTAADAGRLLWSGVVVLTLERPYVLSGPNEAGDCHSNCVTVANSSSTGLLLEALNGVREWHGAGAPSFSDCLNLRKGGTQDAVALGQSDGAWLCVTNGLDNLARVRYEGPAGQHTYRFRVATWARPYPAF